MWCSWGVQASGKWWKPGGKSAPPSLAASALSGSSEWFVFSKYWIISVGVMEESFLCFSERCQTSCPAFLQLEQLFLAASWGVWCGGTNVYCGVWSVIAPKFIGELLEKRLRGETASEKGVCISLQKSNYVLPVDFFLCVFVELKYHLLSNTNIFCVFLTLV